jgi:hypothetical protein
MTTTLSPSLEYVASRHSSKSRATKAVRPRTFRTSLGVAKVGAGLAIVTAALGFGAFSLGAQPIPADHAVVIPAPPQHTVLGRGTLPALHLPVALAP